MAELKQGFENLNYTKVKTYLNSGNVIFSSDDVIEREFGAFDSVHNPSPKYVLSLDEFDMSKDGITHLNIEEWLLNKVDITLS